MRLTAAGKLNQRRLGYAGYQSDQEATSETSLSTA